ncbi:glycoside hydrolase 5 family protein [Paenibacillus glucanolyticus]|uniref:beta-galactosidase n=1 Tax=Paenibacillus glucanolyticus TaxID=59843 RepID=UPI00128D5A28|nr:beta-galactosidase [Paenibacillus glucanolyticus]MPY16981.1 glycoside hydrolase [Paenibacillus glucanolyticus]
MRTLVFYDEHFPYEGERPSEKALEPLRGWGEVADAAAVGERLAEGGWDVLLHLHGPYFPKAAWTTIEAYLKTGGGLVHAGGVPFRRPVRELDGAWHIEREQLAYHQRMDIHDVLKVDVSRVQGLKTSAEYPILQGRGDLFGIEPTWGLTLHPTKASDIPSEMGAGGPMDAVISPLLTGVDRDQRERSAPIVMLEQHKGDFAGGRWILINQQLRASFWETEGLDVLKDLAEYAGMGVTELWLKPNYASYEPGEEMRLTVQLQALSRTSVPASRWHFAVCVMKKDNGEIVWTGHASSEAGMEQRDLQQLHLSVPVRLEAGLYRIVCEAESESGERRCLTQAVWGVDRPLLQAGERLECGRDYFRRGGRSVPIVGMTYMTSDVARKFLHLPNVQRWDADMAEMKRAGINLIRTGIWTGYRMIMFADGHATEDVMRAIDAFILTAKGHELEVTFTFFSFAPEAWEGVNPYLDPRSVEAQKRFIASIVGRHRGTTNVHWDLINEPSLFDPKRIFEGPISIGDRFERQAWSEWLRQRHGNDLSLLQERWNMTPGELPSFDSAPTPSPDDKLFNSVLQPKKWGPWLDFTLFTMDMHNRWASELIGTIRRSDPRQLVTVGQDEGICSQRPSPSFYGPVVDYTTVHSWWQNDHLAWDGIFTKTPDKPNLVQETGIMHVQRPDGVAKRTEEELRSILERKYAYAFSTGGAGAVQWIWNINYFMDNANESNIGALRADGTQKPEADVSYDFGSFMKEASVLFDDERQLEDIVVVYPYSNDFSSRKLAYEATTRAMRTLTFGMNVHPRGIGEYQLEDLKRYSAKLIIVPSAHNFDDEAFAMLLELAREGSTVLWTGPLRTDAYWGEALHRLQAEIGETVQANVLREEMLELAGERFAVSYGERKINVLAVDRPLGRLDGALELFTVTLGKGRLIWCPLPVEMNERWEPIQALYAEALRSAAILPELEWLKGGELPGIYGRKLAFGQGSLYVFVSEHAASAEIEVRDPVSGTGYAFVLERERTVMFMTDAEGQVRTVYRPEEVHIWQSPSSRP